MSQTVSAADALSIDTEVVTDILLGFIRDEVGKVGFERVVLGLSGGVDSALVAALAARALGPEQVIPVINQIAKKFENVVMTQDWHTPGHISFASTHPGKTLRW